MSQVFSEDGRKIPVTLIEAGPCKVVQVKSAEKDGYAAVQIGYGKKKKPNRAQKGHQRGESFMYLREFRVSDPQVYKVGQLISAADFVPGEQVQVSGVMKGRGFAGAVKRHGFHGAPASHGHDHPRAVGAIGGRFPQHVLRGTRMAGRMGGHQVTVKNLSIIDVAPEKNLLVIYGAVPGASKSLVKLQTTGKVEKEPAKIWQRGGADAEKKSPQKAKESPEDQTDKPEASAVDQIKARSA
ncbi:MAG: 50S ribosomal protein L3 [Candidatus Doudnabacteria bacterium]|nr:50S ribosomal protein L3 [Candidatus Doudnabacteria bacterium]